MKNKVSDVFPRCKDHKECFANKDGRCICLKDNNFGDKDCPFYKTKEAQHGR